ncbi:protein DENND6A isoform X2 [Diabrotica virgifera virgifera]|uniref:UDENN domain-containing protein n=1 Tax=Diabrotica virgifera virgifera TaxID=50390 RepID=A0ABM5L9F9_DIAVI|nr:protein DENND6A isoform X2 [Diabrotica virgifera virgifera]
MNKNVKCQKWKCFYNFSTMTDGDNKLYENGIGDAWDSFHNWLYCICVVTFDLELGQALENVFPRHVNLTKQEISNVCYLAFPDSNSGCMGDTNFIIRLQNNQGTKNLRNEHHNYNAKCPTALQVDGSYYWGYVYFRQVKDVSLPRGYFQKTYIPLSTSANSTLALLSEPGDNQIQTNVEDINLFEILQPVLSYIHLLWELVIVSEPIVVMASSPTHCSSMVLALTRLICPLQYCGDYRPYFTIHDSEFKQFTSKSQGPPPVILGVTNPFFGKTLHHWPHTIHLSDDIGQAQKYKLKKTAPTKMIDNSPGVFTAYKPFLQKDKNIIKKLLSGVTSKRPFEVQSAILRRHLLELTQSFMIPLERYIASLMPLQKSIHPFKAPPSPLPFNPDSFFATLEAAGPQLTLNNTGIRGDWVGLYKKFFRSPNFTAWFNTRYTELTMKLQALQTEALSNADLKLWAQERPEVEIVDMVLRIQNKIQKCDQRDIPVDSAIKEKLSLRLNEITSGLPDDLKNILHVS